MNKIVDFSIRHRGLVVLASIVLALAGVWAAVRLPIDAVPDISTKQVVVLTTSPALGPEEVERQITFPIEVALSGLPKATHMRSLSQFGLSQVTVEFADSVDLYFARQIVAERLQDVRDDLPPGTDTPKLAPISTGLGEIFYIVVEGDEYSLMERRTLLDWTIKPQLRTVPGIIEVNSYGGLEKQAQVLIDPERLRSYGLTLDQVHNALLSNNRNAGGAYIARGEEQELVVGLGMVKDLEDIRSIALKSSEGAAVTVGDVARVRLGGALRQGAATYNGKGESVAAIALMLYGENSRTVVQRVREKMEYLQTQMPSGIRLVDFLDRRELVDRTLDTAGHNLVYGGILVVLVLFLFLLQLRAGLIVSSVIPLSLLFAIVLMYRNGVSANLMSLGAIDFGIIVDGSVIIVENCVRRLAMARRAKGVALNDEERIGVIRDATVEVRSAIQFGQIVIMAAYFPILALVGIEGKMFRPMALTVIFALTGAFVLSLTLIPALCATLLKDSGSHSENPLMERLQRWYIPVLRGALAHQRMTVGAAVVFLALSLSLFPTLGAVFLPRLDEGALTINASYLPSISVETAVDRATLLEQIVKRNFSTEVGDVFTRIGRPDIATDPMLLSQHDMMIHLKPRSEWQNARTKDELVRKMEAALSVVPGVQYSFLQPIEMRMNETIEGPGIRGDVGVLVFGNDMEMLQQKAAEIAAVLRKVHGGEDIAVETSEGLPMLQIKLRRPALAAYGMNVDDVQDVIETAIGGQKAGEIAEPGQRYDITLRYDEPFRSNAEAVAGIILTAPDGSRLPLSAVGDIQRLEGPVQVNRENGQRRLVVQANVRGRDLGSFVEEAQRLVAAQVALPPGYHLEWGGQYEHLQSGTARLLTVVPITFAAIFLLLYIAYGRAIDAARVFTGIPFAISGGVLALFVRGMPFSLSAGIGFIALSGIAVLADMVMVQYIRLNLDRGLPLREAVEDAAVTRLRPVLMTAAVASIGFLPMALSTGTGAEVQRPLATVVIGGIVTSTTLTLVVLPALYTLIARRRSPARSTEGATGVWQPSSPK